MDILDASSVDFQLQNGSVNLVFPDIPVMEVPDHSFPYFMLIVAVGKVGQFGLILFATLIITG